MARYTGPRLRVVRRLGDLPGLTRKNVRRQYPPGQHGQNRRKRSEYAIRLEEKQKLRYNYGVSEKQLVRYIKKARRVTGSTGLVLLQLLEMRLDTICFTLGFAPTIANARQLVNHGHITVNGNVVSIPSFQCRLNDIIGVKQKSKSKTLVENNLKSRRFIEYPGHLKFDSSKLEATVVNYCDRGELLLELNELLVIEYYSRR